jgi:hypothetical protein
MLSNTGSLRLGSQLLDAQSSNTDSNMLVDKDDSDFVKDQIKNLDKHFEDQGLFDLKSESNKKNEIYIN